LYIEKDGESVATKYKDSLTFSIVLATVAIVGGAEEDDDRAKTLLKIDAEAATLFKGVVAARLSDLQKTYSTCVPVPLTVQESVKRFFKLNHCGGWMDVQKAIKTIRPSSAS
jgi:hypothetical protein